MMTGKDNLLRTAVILLAVGIGLVNVFLVPPFMNPDEVQHFMFTAGYAYSGDEGRLKEVDRDVLQILKDHRWFHFVGIGPGWETVDQLRDVYFLNYFTRDKRSISKTYFHFIYGKILKLSGIRDSLTAFYFLRLLSLCIYMGIFLLSFYFYRRYFPGGWLYLIIAQLLVFQAGTILNSVNYDVLLTLLGVLFFIAAYRFLESGGGRNILILILFAALASLVKTGGVLFIIYFFILILFRYRFSMKFLKRLPLALLAFVIIFSWFNYLFPDRFFTLYTIIFGKIRSIGNGGGGGMGFFESVLESFYFYTGWMAFKLPGVWYSILKIFLSISIVGAAVGMGIKRLRSGEQGSEIPGIKWLLYVFVITVIHLLSIRLYYGSGLMAQGRYLYPLLIPVIMFVYGGLSYIERFLKFKRTYLNLSYILFLVLFFLAALVRVVSVFYLEYASPHVGL
jgi:hypothetical protein